MEDTTLNTEFIKQGNIVEIRELAQGIFKVTIETTDCNFKGPGQYAIVGVPDSNLERAYSVSEYDSRRFTIVIKNDNPCSEKISEMQIGDVLDVETGLGDGFDVDAIPNRAVLVADTSGIPQMLGLLRELLMQGKVCSLVLGYPSKSSIYMVDTFSTLCNNIEILTADGSNGRMGYAYDAVRNAEYVCAAGSVSMLEKLTGKAEAGQYNIDGMNLIKW